MKSNPSTVAMLWLGGGPRQNFRTVYWIGILQQLKIRYRRPYQCRHTYASAMLMAGMNPKFCAKQLGRDVKVFLTIYADWIGGDADDREMARLEANLKQPKPKKSKD